jgi:glycosyltransferase involved in cell wall biosynthesis
VSNLRTKGGRRVAFVGTYPPSECGIATFTRDLLEAVRQSSSTIEPAVISLDPDGVTKGADGVVFTIHPDRLLEYVDAADFVNSSGFAGVCLQHEYGIFGGTWGENILAFLNRLRVPAWVTLHTVVPNPAPYMAMVLRRVYSACDAAVVMAERARLLLQTDYKVSPSRACLVHHGVPTVEYQATEPAKARFGYPGRIILSTFGLLSKGKGIQDAIRALPKVVKQFPNVTYLVLGQTHPKVRQAEGETYRESLERLVAELGLSENVEFVNRYLTFDELVSYLLATDIYITPYHGRNQIVSGTLAYAVGSGRAVISTPYLYAEEVLAEDRGILVPFEDPDAMQSGILRLLTNPGELEKMRKRAYEFGRRMTWPNVGKSYVRLFEATWASRVEPMVAAVPAGGSASATVSGMVTTAGTADPRFSPRAPREPTLD